MADVQVGQSIEVMPIHKRFPRRSWINPLRFEDKEEWGVIDTAIVQAIVCMTEVNEDSQISYKELVRRLHEGLHVDEKYLHASLSRLLREPPSNVDGMVKRFEFRPRPVIILSRY